MLMAVLDDDTGAKRRDASEWNDWLAQQRAASLPIDLSRADLVGADLCCVDLSGANLSGADLSNAHLSGANLSGANLHGAIIAGADMDCVNLTRADLTAADVRCACVAQSDLTRAILVKANLSRADFSNAELAEADLSEVIGTSADFNGACLFAARIFNASLKAANLTKADLSWANLSRTDLTGSLLIEADLSFVQMIQTNFTSAVLERARVYGISAWDVCVDDADMSNLTITRCGEQNITVDNLKIAQFIYLLLNNKEVRHVIETVTSKAVLILGRFTAERKRVLDALREELRKHDYVPLLFDFDKPGSLDLTETISTLAHMSRFVIADITDAKSIPQELGRIVPSLPSVPVQPLLLASEFEYSMFEHFRRFPWVLRTFQYESLEHAIENLYEKVIAPAEAKAVEQRDYLNC